MSNVNFKPLFESVDNLKARMRNCLTESEWQSLREEYKALLASAKSIYTKYSSEEKYQEFRNRENNTITNIHQKVKRRWSDVNSQLEETVVAVPEKKYVLYDDTNYEKDLANEMRYWQTELFPMAIANKLAMYEIEALYNHHLQEQYWNQQKMTCNPNIDLRNEMRIQWALYKREEEYGDVTAEYIDSFSNTIQEPQQSNSNSDQDIPF